MRLLLASLAAVTAVAFAAPAFAQDTPPAPTPAVKHVKHKTSCSALKSESAKATCLKRAHAHATKPHHKKTKRVASKAPAAPRVAPTDSVPAVQSAPSPSPSQPIAVPPLPQKTL